MKFRVFEKRPGAWHLDFRLEDGRRLRPFGGTTRAEAERAAPRVLAAALSSGPASAPAAPQRQPAKAVSGATLEGAFKLAMRVRESWITSKDKGTLQTTFDAIVATASPAGTGNPPGTVVAADMALSLFDREFVRALRACWLAEPGKRHGTTLSRSTINHRLSMLTVLLEVADLPPHGVKHLSVKGTRRTRRISDDEVQALRAWCFAHSGRLGAMGLHDMVILGLDCCAREGELLALTWADYADGAVTFHDTKNGESRTVPLTERAGALLEARRGLAAPFADLTQGRLINLWSDARKAMGLATDDEFVFHALRHEGISRLVETPGVSPFTVQAIAGHANITTTQVYAHASLGAMKRAIQGAPA